MVLVLKVSEYGATVLSLILNILGEPGIKLRTLGPKASDL